MPTLDLTRATWRKSTRSGGQGNCVEVAETPVGVVEDRDEALVVSLLAVLKAGGCYLGIDSRQPAERTAAMLAAAGARLVLTAGPPPDLGEGVTVVEVPALDLSAAVVDSLDTAIGHIARFGSGHSEAIVTGSLAAARDFTARVDAAAVLVNASTRFTDGEEFGFGAEIGISTQKLHARGPMGLRELTTYKYVIWGDGQIRG